MTKIFRSEVSSHYGIQDIRRSFMTGPRPKGRRMAHAAHFFEQRRAQMRQLSAPISIQSLWFHSMRSCSGIGGSKGRIFSRCSSVKPHSIKRFSAHDPKRVLARASHPANLATGRPQLGRQRLLRRFGSNQPTPGFTRISTPPTQQMTHIARALHANSSNKLPIAS